MERKAPEDRGRWFHIKTESPVDVRAVLAALQVTDVLDLGHDELECAAYANTWVGMRRARRQQAAAAAAAAAVDDAEAGGAPAGDLSRALFRIRVHTTPTEVTVNQFECASVNDWHQFFAAFKQRVLAASQPAAAE